MNYCFELGVRKWNPLEAPLSLQRYLVHISVGPTSYPLDQLEILLRVPPGQVHAGVHHVLCQLRHRSRAVDAPPTKTVNGYFRKNIRCQKISA